MNVEELNPGDVVYAASTLTNDGSIPGVPQDAILAKTGTRGVLINTGYIEWDPAQKIFLVRFESDDTELGPPVGCRPDELTLTPLGAIT